MTGRGRRAEQPAIATGRLAGGSVLLLVLAVLATGCAGPAMAGAHDITARRHVTSPRRALASAVEAQARLFMTRFRAGMFDRQWPQLAPEARAAWGSRAARDAMLTRKFGRLRIAAVGVGPAAGGGTWTSAENTRLTAAGVWRVPVSVRFASAGLQPGDAEASYTRLALDLIIPSGRPLVLGEGPASLDAPLVERAGAPVRAARVPILMYHLVGQYPARSQWTDDYGYRIEAGLTVPTAQFAAEMAYLAGHRYHAISLTRLADNLLYGLPLPPRPVVLTFDDGRLSPWVNAVPVMRRYGFTAEFFVCAGFIGQTNQTASHLNVQRYLSWSQINSLAGDGFWIEDHGQKDISVLWSVPPTVLRAEVDQSARLLAARTGQPVQFLAYTGALWPYASAAQAGPAQEALFPKLAQIRYAGAVVDSSLPSTVESSRQMWQLPRVRIFPGESITAFAAALR